MAPPPTTQQQLTPESDLFCVSFKDATWLTQFGLSEENAIAYLSLSQFYDPSCCNQQLLMQSRFNSLVLSQSMKNMVGKQYIVLKNNNQDPFVIHCIYRTSPNAVELLSVYYIIQGTIYQSPDLKRILSARLMSAVHLMGKAFQPVLEYAGSSDKRQEAGKGTEPNLVSSIAEQASYIGLENSFLRSNYDAFQSVMKEIEQATEKSDG